MVQNPQVSRILTVNLQVKVAESARLADMAEAARRKADRFRVTEIELEVHSQRHANFISKEKIPSCN